MSFLSGRLWILKTTTKIKKYLKWIFLSSLCGLLSGTATFVFLQSLSFITDLREKTPLLIFGLPFAGLLIGYLYFLSGSSTTKGTTLILEEIHDPKNVVPFRMAPLIFFSTLLTHLFGGSAGREGTAVQIGSSLSDQLFHFFSDFSRGKKNTSRCRCQRRF
jgi:H+/Cl- antiporter ClcA